MKAALTKTWSVRRVRAGRAAQLTPDALATEEPLELRVRGQAVAVIMRTPGHDADLAAGAGPTTLRSTAVDAEDLPDVPTVMPIVPSSSAICTRNARRVFGSRW